MNQEHLEKIFLQSFTEFSDAIFRFCVVKVTDTALAEDMTQEVFMRYWRYVREEKQIDNTRALLYTIANNLAKDWYKKKKSVSLDQKLEAGMGFPSTDISQETSAAYREALDAIADLEPRDKEVLLLRFVEGLGPNEIAEIVHETANSVSVRINRAMVKLREHMHI